MNIVYYILGGVTKMAQQKNNTKKTTPTKTETKKIKLNVNYVDFIERVINEKLTNASKEKLVTLYLETVKVKSHYNIKRVNGRVFREPLQSLLKNELLKREIPKSEFEKTCDLIVTKISEKGESNNYIAI